MKSKIVVALKGLILNRGRVLIVQRSSDDEIGGGTWECVGGKLEFGEELEPALQREIVEEVGIVAAVDKLLYATTFKTHPLRQVVILTYLCHAQSTHVTLSSEHVTHLWANKEQMQELLAPAILRDFEKHDVFKQIGSLEPPQLPTRHA